MRRFSVVLWVLLLAACGAPQGKTGSAALLTPVDDSLIYASALAVTGTSDGVNQAGLLLTLADESGAVLSQATVAADQKTWAVELIHGYAGDRLPVMLNLRAADDPTAEPYATRSLTLAGFQHRPEGAFIDVFDPAPGVEVGGDEIGVSGRASGVGQTFTVQLVGSDGTILSESLVTLSSPYAVDDVPWQASLPTSGVTGSALIVITADSVDTQRIPVVLSSSAG
jgi:hypothetical protein